MTDIKLSEADVQNCTWTFEEEDELYRSYIGRGTHPVTGLPITVRKREPKVEAVLIEQNKAAQNDSDGTRWGSGMGSEKRGNVPMVLVARTPLNKWLEEHAEAEQQGDKDFDRWWLNRPENEPFRTRRGTI